MLFGPKLGTALCLLVCLCNGAPPRKAGESSGSRTRFTVQEDKFIVQELLNRLDGVIEVYSNNLWDQIHKKHTEKFTTKTEGFPKERTVRALRNRFREKLLPNHPNIKVKVPEILLQKIHQASEYKKREGRDRKRWYSQEENDFIFKELLQPYCTSLTGPRSLGPIIEKHNSKRLAKTVGFENERNVHGLHMHLLHLKRTAQLPKEVAAKFLNDGEGGSSSTSTTQETYLQGTNEDEPWVGEWIEELHNDSNFDISNEEN